MLIFVDLCDLLSIHYEPNTTLFVSKLLTNVYNPTELKQGIVYIKLIMVLNRRIKINLKVTLITPCTNDVNYT